MLIKYVKGIKTLDKDFLKDLAKYEADELIKRYGFKLSDTFTIQATKSPYNNLDAKAQWDLDSKPQYSEENEKIEAIWGLLFDQR